MRIIKFLAKSVLVIALLAGVGFLVVRETLLQLAISQVHTSLVNMRKADNQAGGYFETCRAKGITPISGSVVESVRLRFTSEKDYVVEVVCAQYSLDPILVESQTLPNFVTKIPGRSGITWGNELSGVTFELWGRQRGLFVEDQEIHGGIIVQSVNLEQPPTTCEGFGYTCCVADTSVGEDEVFGSATDCPKTCYASCRPRPVILSLATQPFYEPQNRTLEIGRGEPVEVNYVLDDQGIEISEVAIDFGDGQRESLGTAINGNTTHTYNCDQEQCLYQIKIGARNVNDDWSAETKTSQVNVVVR